MLGSVRGTEQRGLLRAPSAARVSAWWRGSSRVQLIRLIPGASGPITMALVVLVLLSPLLSLTFTIATGQLVGSVAGAVRLGFASPPGHRLVTALVVLGVAFVVQYASAGLREVLGLVMSRRLDRQLRSRVLDATLGPPGVAHLEDPAVLDKIAVTRAEATGITPGLAAFSVVQVAVNRLAVVPPAILLASFRWWLPIAVGGALLWMRVIMRNHILLSVNAQLAQSAQLRRAQYFVDAALTPAAAKETRVFGLGPWLGERFGAHYLQAMASVWRARAGGQRRLVPPVLASFVVNTAGYLLIVHAATTGELDIARLTIMLTSMGGMRMLLAIGNEDVQLEQGAAIVPAIIDIERTLGERREDLRGTGIPDGLPRSSVRFEHVGFRYPGSDRDVYQGLDLEVRAGESLAVVGVNGAGKTTLVKLLARLHDPTAGRITVDGGDLRQLDPTLWQRRVAAIFQDFTRYELPARDNVAFGALELRDDEHALVAAAHAAGAGEIIDGLSAGWDTTLSRRFTGGTDLSGGQWQRIALARALLAVQAGAGILVLDEPTANLDVRAEADLYDRFLELTRGVTTVVISHRFSTVRRADRIVVLDGGCVVEGGTHDQLLAAGGHYARMFRLQAARFTDTDTDTEVEEAGRG